MAAAVQTQGIRIVRQLRTFMSYGIVQVKRLRPIADTLYRQCNLALTLAGIYAKGHLVDSSCYVHAHGTSPGNSVHLRDLLQFRIQQDYGILICLIAVRSIILPRQQGRAAICISLRCQPQDRVLGRSGTQGRRDLLRLSLHHGGIEMNDLQIGTGCRTFRFRFGRIFQLYKEGLHRGDNGSGSSISISIFPCHIRRTDNKTLSNLRIQCPIFLR